MSDEELKKEFEKIREQISNSRYDGTWIFILALLFIGGCFKGCGY